jgi:hypothetical protein
MSLHMLHAFSCKRHMVQACTDMIDFSKLPDLLPYLYVKVFQASRQLQPSQVAALGQPMQTLCVNDTRICSLNTEVLEGRQALQVKLRFSVKL